MTNLEFKKDSTWGPISNLTLDSIVIAMDYRAAGALPQTAGRSNIAYRLKLQSENTLRFSQIPRQPMNFSADMGCLGPDLNTDHPKVIKCAAIGGGYAPINGWEPSQIRCAKSRLRAKSAQNRSSVWWFLTF